LFLLLFAGSDVQQLQVLEDIEMQCGVVLIVHFKSSAGAEVHVSRHKAAKVEFVETEICCEEKIHAERTKNVLSALEPSQCTLRLSETVVHES
jgi:hypothetical protein